MAPVCCLQTKQPKQSDAKREWPRSVPYFLMRHLPTIEAGHWLRLDPQYVTGRTTPALSFLLRRASYCDYLA